MADQGKKKIGFIFDDAPPSRQAMDMLRRLDLIDGLDITLVQNTFPDSNRFGLKRKLREYGPVSFTNKLVFAAYSALEEKITRRQASDSPPPPDLTGRKIITIAPLPSKRNLFYRYSDLDIAKITEQNFDLLVRGDGRGIVKGEILNTARDGFLSLHYGDNRVFRGVPAGFWEVYYKRRETGFIIQLLNEVLDGGNVIARGTYPTQPPYTRNWYSISSQAHEMFEIIMRDYAQNKGLPPVEKGGQPLGELLTTPNIWQLLNYIRNLFTKKIPHELE